MEESEELCLGMGDPKTPYFQMGVKRVARALFEADRDAEARTVAAFKSAWTFVVPYIQHDVGCPGTDPDKGKCRCGASTYVNDVRDLLAPA